MASSKCTQKLLTNKLEIMSKKIMPFLMRHEAAKPFLKPVDFIAFQLPEYPNIIKSPIDLSTIKERLIMKFYDNFIKCLEDFNLMLGNCYLYNPPDDPIILMGLQLKNYFDIKIKAMPTEEFKLKNSMKKKFVPLKKNMKKIVYKNKLKSEQLINLNQMIMKENCEKIININNSMTNNEYEKCLLLISELMSSKYKSINYLFLKPVDAKSMGLNDYHEHVKYPIDLSTIQTYLLDKLYDTRMAFINDIYLMLNNCIVYNGRDTDIGIICRRFQNDFESLYYQIFKEKCRENVNDEAFYFLMKIKRKHKEIEEMIRFNTEKISVARSRIDMIVNLFEKNKAHLRQDKKRKMFIKYPHSSPTKNSNSYKKVKNRLKENSKIFQIGI